MAGTTSLPTKSLLPLASFAHNWVGGDIHGLGAFASTLYRYVPDMEDVVTALNKKVGQIVTDAGWRGTAAQAFTGNWEQISAEINAIGLVVIETGSVVDQLAADLSRIENALERAAAMAQAHGVQIGADGQPPQVCYADKTREDWRVGYASFYQRCKADAEDARVQAAGALVKLGHAVTSGKPGKPGDAGGDPGGAGTKVVEGNTIGDLLADLLAAKTTYTNQVADKVAEATGKLTKAQKEWLAAQAAARQANGRFGVMPDDVKGTLKDVKTELASVEDALTKAQGGENAISKLFGTRLDDLPGLGKVVDGLPGGLGDAKLLSKALDLPVVDVVAGGLSTVINAQQDIGKGVPAWAAYPLETGVTVGSIALATTVGGAVAGLTIFAGAPVAGVVAGVAAAGVVAYGVGDFAHNYIADFGEQWKEHGVLGVVTDFGAAGADTWNDTKHLASDVGNVASSAWHGITSLF
ncbi:MAG TPA: WXG100 family type VII secretion target [Streptosporangiaceae bacterium]|nr:WXG100 family type VII secretion target [Streptosporangiaceae bacterium]